MRNHMQRSGPLPKPHPDLVGQRRGGSFEVFSPVERRDRDAVAAELQVGRHQVVHGRDRPSRLDPDAKLRIVLDLVGQEIAELQRRELIAVDNQSRVDPDQAVPAGRVGQGTAHEPGDDDHVIGAEKEAKPLARAMPLGTKGEQMVKLALGDDSIGGIQSRVGGLGLKDRLSVALIEQGHQRPGLGDPAAARVAVQGIDRGHGTTPPARSESNSLRGVDPSRRPDASAKFGQWPDRAKSAPDGLEHSPGRASMRSVRCAPARRWTDHARPCGT